MSEEQLQNESGVLDKNGQPVIEDQNNGADLATASESVHEEQPKVEESAEDKAKAAQVKSDDAINKQHRKFRDEQRISTGLRDELNDIKAKEQAKLAESFRNAPAIPEMPTYPTSDPFDDGHDIAVRSFHEDMAKYNANMPTYYQQVKDKSDFDAQQTNLLQNQQLQQQQEQQKQALKAQEQTIVYSTRSTELGIKPEELQAAGNAVAQYGLSNDLVMHILSDKDGPLITKHLAANPLDGHTLATMNPYSVGAFLDGIKLKAAELKPKTTNAPQPVDQLSGAGAQPDLNYPNSEGATFT